MTERRHPMWVTMVLALLVAVPALVAGGTGADPVGALPAGCRYMRDAPPQYESGIRSDLAADWTRATGQLVTPGQIDFQLSVVATVGDYGGAIFVASADPNRFAYQVFVAQNEPDTGEWHFSPESGFPTPSAAALTRRILDDQSHWIPRSFVDCWERAFVVATSVHYFALGDSYSSGEGVRPYLNGTATTINNCHRSTDAFPRRLALPGHDRPIHGEASSRVHFIACSGADLGDVLNTAQYSSQPAQLAQLAASANPTGLVSITIGGNSIGFGEILGACARTSNCPDTPLTTGRTVDGEIDFRLQAFRSAWVNVFQQLRNRSSSVWVLGYPPLFPDSVNEQRCSKLRLLGFSAGEQDFLRSKEDQMLAVIQSAAVQAGVHYVDVSRRFSDHEVCGDGGEWLSGPVLAQIGVPSLPLDLNLSHLIGRGSFHPNPTGQFQYAQALQARIARLERAGCRLTAGLLPSNPSPGSPGNCG